MSTEQEGWISSFAPQQLSLYLSSTTTILYRFFVAAVVVFLLLPIIIIPIISIGESRFATGLPTSFTLKWYANIPQTFAYFSIVEAAITSTLIALTTAVITTVIGSLAAFAIVRREFRFDTTLQTLLISPLVYPWLIIGLGILLFISEIQSALGISIKMSFWTVLVGHITFAIPYPIRTIGASLENYDESLDEAARNLGATEIGTYRRITFPLIKPGVISGMVLVLILSFNQYIITLFLKGASVKTVPILIFSMFRVLSPAEIAVLATILMVAQLFLVFVTEVTVGITDYL